MGWVGGELVPGRCEDAPCCGCGDEGCVQPGETEDKEYWALRAAIEDGEPPEDFFDEENDFEEEWEDD